jgi:hypothetical protein
VRSRDSEIRQVVSDLDRLLDGLRDNVDLLNEILTRPVPPDGGEADERLVSP